MIVVCIYVNVKVMDKNVGVHIIICIIFLISLFIGDENLEIPLNLSS